MLMILQLLPSDVQVKERILKATFTGKCYFSSHLKPNLN